MAMTKVGTKVEMMPDKELEPSFRLLPADYREY